jgi:NADH:ubiquinone oxidoreductase subunit 2 (subunit N)
LILIIKLGIAPFHLWFMAIIDKISVLNLIWVSIVQKIIPLRFVMLLKADENLILGLGLRFLISSVHILLQRKLKKIIGASSIYSACWVIISRIVCEALSWGFFIAYRIFQVFLLSLRIIKLITPLKSSFAQRSWMHMCLILLILSISGFPPSPLFFIKLRVLIQFIVNGHLGWSLALRLGARIVIFNYLNIIRILFTFNPRNYVV